MICRKRGWKKCNSRNWLTPRRSHTSPCGAGFGRRRGIALEDGHVVSVAGQQHRRAQTDDTATDHDDPSHNPTSRGCADPIRHACELTTPGGYANPGFAAGSVFGSCAALVHAIRFLFPVLIVAAVVGLVVSVVSACPDLQKAKRQVDASWTDLTPHLDARYALLATADAKLHTTSGPVHQLIANVDAALVQWRQVSGHASVREQVDAANALEALSRRLLATANVSPRVAADTAARTALSAFSGDQTLSTANGFNTTVATYERDRRGPIRHFVANMLGADDIPALDTTGPAA